MKSIGIEVVSSSFEVFETTSKFDAIWMSHILEHTLNVGSFLRKARSLLQDGGWLFEFGGVVFMTSTDHISGADRLVEVMEQVHADLYVNIQGDEPLIRPADISKLISGMKNSSELQVSTLCHPISATKAHNSNCIKVVVSANKEALYFSRSPIPYPRQEETASYLKHVGVYAYRREVLECYAKLPQPMLEKTEVLEQLRLMYAGIRIHTFEVLPTGPGVDSPECLERVRA